MNDYSLNEQDLFNATLSSVTELGHCTFHCEELSEAEKEILLDCASEIDVDYLMIKEECSILLSKPQISNFFVDFTAEFFPRAVKCGIYSCTIKSVLAIGRVGEYKISTLCTPKHRMEIFEEDEMNDYLDDTEIETEEDESITRRDINSRLTQISRIHSGQMSFGRMEEIMLQFFCGYTIVIYKYGQKVQLRQMKTKLVSIILDAQLPIELALGIQYKVDDRFLSAGITADTMKFGFSNFLSNEMGNIRINLPAIAEIYCENSYRICLYNTLQHHKKHLKLQLERSSNTENCSLYSFEESLTEIDGQLRELGNKLDEAELRLELYFNVRNLNELETSITSMKTLIGKFHIVQKPLIDVQRIFKQRRKLLKAFYSYTREWSDITSIYFLTYFQKYKAFIQSTERTTKAFIENNCGMFLKESWFDKVTKKPTRHYFEANTVVTFKYILESVFGNSKTSNPIFLYYYIMYYNHFKAYIEPNNEMTRKMAEHVCKYMIGNEKQSSAASSTVSCDVLLGDAIQVLLSKSRNSFFVGFLKHLQVISTTNSVFRIELVTMLSKQKFQTVKGRNCYKLNENPDVYGSSVSWSEVVDFVERQKFNNVMDALCRTSLDENSGTLHGENVKNESFPETDRMKADKFFRVFQKKEQPACEDHFFDKKLILDECKFKVTQDVFLSFLFTTYAIDLQDVNSRLEKAVKLFNSFSDFSKFVYASCYKYYLPFNVYLPNKLKKFFQNLISVKRYMNKGDEFGLTFCRLAYFSGRFDRRYGMEGLFLPISQRMDLKSRLGLEPHCLLGEDKNLNSNHLTMFKPLNVTNFLDNLFGKHVVDSDVENEFECKDERNSMERAKKESPRYFELMQRKINAQEKIDTNTMNIQKEGKLPVPKKRRNSQQADLFSDSEWEERQNDNVFSPSLLPEEAEDMFQRLFPEFGQKESKSQLNSFVKPLNEIESHLLVPLTRTMEYDDKSFRDNLEYLFPSKDDVEFINLLISMKITAKLIVESSMSELELALKRFCKMSSLIARCTAETLKSHFDSE